MQRYDYHANNNADSFEPLISLSSIVWPYRKECCWYVCHSLCTFVYYIAAANRCLLSCRTPAAEM
jgi:hypothetical protein